MSPLFQDEPSEAVTLRVIRGLLLLLFLFGLFGTGLELFLVEHTEKFWQPTPLLLMAISLAVLGWRAAGHGPASLRVFQGIMILFVLSGFFGLWLHFRANIEFELEMYPALKGMSLFWKAIQGVSPPSLAPGMMIELGLLGMGYTFRHPILVGSKGRESNDKGATL